MRLKFHELFHVKLEFRTVLFQVKLRVRASIVARDATLQLAPRVRSWPGSHYFNPNLCEQWIEVLGLNERIQLLLCFNSQNGRTE